MTMKQARARYRKAVKAHKAEFPDAPMAISLRAYARWMCVGDIVPTGKLAQICAKQAARR